MQSRDDLLEAHERLGSTPLENYHPSSNIIKEGWLQKRSQYLGQYRKRWIVLQPNHLYSYKKKQEYKSHTQDIDLTKILKISELDEKEDTESEQNKNNQTYEFVVDEQYRFIANSDYDRKQWIDSIKNWLNFNVDIREYRKKWKKLIYDRTVKRMELESLNIINCISFHDCQCTKRIIFILNFYRIWCVKHDLNKWIGISIESILKNKFGFSSYNTIQLMNDWNHLLRAHFYKNKTHFFNYFISQIGICGKNKLNCISWLRNNRNKGSDKQAKEVYFDYTKPSDVIAMQLLDSFHCFISHNCEKESHRFEEKKEEKESVENDLMSTLVQSQDNIRFKKYTTTANSNHNNNFSYWVCDKARTNYVLPKFKQLKQELLHNNICSLSISQWNIIRERAMKHKYCLFGKSMIANKINEWNKRTDIKPLTPILIKHIIVLLLNTNYTTLAVNFKQIHCHERIKKNQSHIANYMRLLFECVYLYGGVVMYNDQFYHYLSDQRTLKQLQQTHSFPMLTFKSPISCTIGNRKRFDFVDESVCLELIANTNATMPYFNVNWLTDFIDENEMLLFRISLNVNHIYYANESKNNTLFQAFKLFIAITEGVFFTNKQSLMNTQTQHILTQILSDKNQGNIPFMFQCYMKSNGKLWLNEIECAKLDKTLQSTVMSYSENNNIRIDKMQCFQWIATAPSASNENTLLNMNGPTIMYFQANDPNSFQIAFDTFYLNGKDFNSFYFSLSSMPMQLKKITVSFYLYCIEKDFYAQCLNAVMSLISQNGVKRVGMRCFDNTYQNSTQYTWKIAVKVVDYL